MYGIIVVLIVASTVDSCFAPLPREFHKVPRKLIWGIMTSFVLNVAALIVLSSSPILGSGLSLLAFTIYFVIRAIAFLGLDYSFRAFAREHDVRMSPAGTMLAWLASSIDALGFLVIMAAEVVDLVRYQALTPQKANSYESALTITLLGGLVLTALFLAVMNSNKNKVMAYMREESLKKAAARAQERKLAQSANAGEVPAP